MKGTSDILQAMKKTRGNVILLFRLQTRIVINNPNSVWKWMCHGFTSALDSTSLFILQQSPKCSLDLYDAYLGNVARMALA